MKRMIRATLVVAVLLGSVGTANAQDVRVSKKAAPAAGPDQYVVYDSWTVSVALRDDSAPSIDWGTYPTEALAVAAAYQGLAKNHAVSPPSAWTYARFCTVVGEASVRNTNSPTFPSAEKVQDDTLADLKKETQDLLKKFLKEDIENAFKNKTRELKEVYDRVMEFKDYAIKNVGKVADDEFDKVNNLIAQYNGKANQYKSDKRFGDYFDALPKLKPTTPADIKQWVGAFNAVMKGKSILDNAKSSLDSQKLKLDKERNDIMNAPPSADKAAQVAKYKQELNNYNGQLHKYEAQNDKQKQLLAELPAYVPPVIKPKSLNPNLNPEPTPVVKLTPPKPNPNPFPNPPPSPTPKPNLNPFVNPVPNPVPNPPAGLAGSQWTGFETLSGYNKLTFKLSPGGGATMYDADGSTGGNWSQSGNSVTLKFYSGKVTYQGSINGNSMSGTGNNGFKSWTFSLNRQF